MDAFSTPLTEYGIGAALSLIPGYVLAPTGGRVHYVHSSGRQSGDPPALANVVTTVNAALARCRANRGDMIIVGAGHTETLTGTDVWSSAVAGVTILGLGGPTNSPLFTLGTAATDQLLLNDANVRIANCRFAQSGTVDVAIDVAAAGVVLEDCYVAASGASTAMTRALRLSSGADDFVARRLKIVGGATAMTDTCLINAAVARPRFLGVDFSASLGTAQGLITAAAAATEVRILGDNGRPTILHNKVAAATVALKGHATWTGFVDDVLLCVANGVAVDMVLTSGVACTQPEPNLVAAFNTPGTINVGHNVRVGRANGKFAIQTTVSDTGTIS